MPAIPVLIVGGYLGAGKTTLVNHLLRLSGGRRIAVMVNDFGELAIDADLIEGADGPVLALAGGCVCCSFGSDLMGALHDVLQRQPAPDMILIEASGVARPGSVARSARLLPGLQIDGIVLMVDSESIRQRIADPYVGELVRQQLREADLLIVNKAELCGPVALAELNAWLKTMCLPGTALIPATQAQVPAELVLGFHASPGVGNQGATADPLALWAAKAVGMRSGTAADLFVSELLRLDAPLDPAPLLEALRTQNHGVVRAKGWLTDLSGQAYLLQLVGRRLDLQKLQPDAPPHGPDRLLVIGLAGFYAGLGSFLSPQRE